jgi:hypothetical protein
MRRVGASRGGRGGYYVRVVPRPDFIGLQDLGFNR